MDLSEYRELAYSTGYLFNRMILGHYYEQYRGKLSNLQAKALEIVIEKKMLTLGELAWELNVPKQHCSKITQALFSQGYLSKTQDMEDKRTLNLRATKKGTALVAGYVNDNFNYVQSLVSVLNEEETDELIQAMQSLNVLFTKMRDKK